MSYNTYILDMHTEKLFSQTRSTQYKVEIDFSVEIRHETIHKSKI